MSVVGPYMLCNGIYSTHKLLTTPEHESSFDYLDPHFAHNIYMYMHTVHIVMCYALTNQYIIGYHLSVISRSAVATPYIGIEQV